MRARIALAAPPAALLFALALPAAAAAAEATLVAARALRAHSVIAPADVRLVPGATPGALDDPAAAIGLETRMAIYPGRPIRADQLGPPALIERNATVTLRYRRGGLLITAEGRALTRAGAGDRVRVMNLDSRAIVTGILGPDGVVEVGR
ncbi:MAG: flagella basal body P-ring formation protein FlgA [Alphaproteobacteria bacterium]|nr:MAG: flagella basal body P-ring formation protein FlgA [Alphaproteobacteria bacterium]